METTLGDRMKRYELEEAGRRMLPRLPIMARLDGRAFHTFTQGLERPYSTRFVRCMVDTTRLLVERYHADLAYTQSDEITLYWRNSDIKASMLFDGRFQKWTSLLAASATLRFGKTVARWLPEKLRLDPEFDCRVWQVPNEQEAYHAFLWREDDATRNSLQMAAQHYFTHEQLMYKDAAQLHDLLYSVGINWNDYPAFFKRGTYVRRIKHERMLTADELARIPEQHRPTTPVARSAVLPLDAPPLLSLKSLTPLLEGGTVPAQNVTTFPPLEPITTTELS